MNYFQRGYYDVLVKLGLDESTTDKPIPPEPKTQLGKDWKKRLGDLAEAKSLQTMKNFKRPVLDKP